MIEVYQSNQRSSDAWKEIEYDAYKGYLIEYRYAYHRGTYFVRYRIRNSNDVIIHRNIFLKHKTDKEAFQEAKNIIDKL